MTGVFLVWWCLGNVTTKAAPSHQAAARAKSRRGTLCAVIWTWTPARCRTWQLHRSCPQPWSYGGFSLSLPPTLTPLPPTLTTFVVQYSTKHCALRLSLWSLVRLVPCACVCRACVPCAYAPCAYAPCVYVPCVHVPCVYVPCVYVPCVHVPCVLHVCACWCMSGQVHHQWR